MFESQDRGSTQNLTDKRFFWLALYAQPGLWVGLAIFAIVRFENPIWLSLVGELGLFFTHKPASLSLFGTSHRNHFEMLIFFPPLLNPSAPSYCSHTHNHKHARLLALRQIQSRIQSCFKCHLFGRYRSESCGWRLQPLVQQQSLNWSPGWFVLVQEHLARQERGCIYGILGNLRIKEGELMYSVPNGFKIIAFDMGILNGIRYEIINLVL